MVIAAALALLLFDPGLASAQRRPPARKQPAAQPPQSAPKPQPAYKGIFEPVNYKQDLKLLDAFFVTPEEGWVSGAAGTILHTSDGGKTWTAQMGGDPQAQGPGINRLFFLDRVHGWAQAFGHFYRTTDGQNWQETGSDVRGNVAFTTPTRGFRGYGGIIYQTLDGGATWKEIFHCVTQATVQGLTQQIRCDVNAIQFPSQRVGYGVGSSSLLGGGVVVKTEDGGSTWNVIFMPQESGDQRTNEVFFLDENHGFVLRNTGMYQTTDGGKSWQGVAATLPRNDAPVRFADPQVGWILAELPANFGTARVAYTTDGGGHWLARDLPVPAPVNGFSLPRRDTGYFVGEHGMVYRYRIVPTTYTAANIINAPLMPGLDSPLNGEVATLKADVNDLTTQMQSSLGISPAPAGAATGNAPQASAAGGFQQPAPGQDTGGFQQSMPQPTQAAPGPDTGEGGFQQSTPPPPGQDTGQGFQQSAGAAGGIVTSCCGATFQKLQTAANSFATDLPQFSGKFRNLNLLTAGLQFVNDLMQRTNGLKQAIMNLRQAKDKQSAALALGALSGNVNGIPSDVNGGFVQDTSTAFPPSAPAPISFSPVPQPQPGNQNPPPDQSSQQQQSQQQQQPQQQQKKKSRWGIPNIPSVPVPH